VFPLAAGMALLGHNRKTSTVLVDRCRCAGTGEWRLMINIQGELLEKLRLRLASGLYSSRKRFAQHEAV